MAGQGRPLMFTVSWRGGVPPSSTGRMPSLGARSQRNITAGGKRGKDGPVCTEILQIEADLYLMHTTSRGTQEGFLRWEEMMHTVNNNASLHSLTTSWSCGLAPEACKQAGAHNASTCTCSIMCCKLCSLMKALKNNNHISSKIYFAIQAKICLTVSFIEPFNELLSKTLSKWFHGLRAEEQQTSLLQYIFLCSFSVGPLWVLGNARTHARGHSRTQFCAPVLWTEQPEDDYYGFTQPLAGVVTVREHTNDDRDGRTDCPLWKGWLNHSRVHALKLAPNWIAQLWCISKRWVQGKKRAKTLSVT